MATSRTPVLIGAAQLIGRIEDPEQAQSPIDMMEQIAREAAEDSGSGSAALNRIDTVSVVDSTGWNPRNPPRLLADRLGLSPKRQPLSLTKLRPPTSSVEKSS